MRFHPPLCTEEQEEREVWGKGGEKVRVSLVRSRENKCPPALSLSTWQKLLTSPLCFNAPRLLRFSLHLCCTGSLDSKMCWARIIQRELGRTEEVGFTGLCRVPQLKLHSPQHLRITLDFPLFHPEVSRKLLVILPRDCIRHTPTMNLNPFMLDSG